MKRSLLALTAFTFLASIANAQTVDWKSLGRPLDDDTKAMRDRYVYSQAETTTDKTVGVDKPVLSPEDVVVWLTPHISELYDLNSMNYDQKTIANQKYFTPKGYAEYIGSLNAAQLPAVVKQKRYSLAAVVPEPATVVAKGLRDEGDKTQPNPVPQYVYVWEVDAPVTLVYRNPDMTDTKNYKVTAKVELIRIPMKEDTTLVAINGWSLQEYKPAYVPSTATSNP